jgi:dihydroneopterin aldolase
MSVTRNGKIARLPRAVREQLNCRLRDGEEGKQLVRWLNGLPEVRTLVTAEFSGKPIREQNLSEWKKGGYREWIVHQEAIELAEKLAEDALDWDAKGHAPLTDTLALWLASRYAMATRRVAETEGTEGWRLLRELCADVAELRRGDHSAQRLLLERERAAAQARDAHMKWKRKITTALETLTKYATKHPKAQAALAELARHVRHPFDPTESE